MEINRITRQPIFKDNRGFFVPTGLKKEWVQSNISYNDKPFVFRGMHLQKPPMSQSKQVTVIKGKIIDFIICLEKENFCNVESYIMSEGDSLLVPNTYAHGFLTLEPDTIVQYFVDENYSKDDEVSILWDTVPYIKDVINTFVNENDIIISEKDKQGLNFKDAFGFK